MLRAVYGQSGLRAALLLLCASAALAQSDALAAKSARVKDLMSTGQFAEAIPLCAELVRALPGNPGLRLNLGLALQMAGRNQEAIPEFEQVLRVQPNSFPAAVSLGAAHLQLNDPAGAVAPLDKAVRLSPNDVNARGMLAAALVAVGRAKDAAVHFRKLTSLAPADPKSWHGLGQTYETLAGQAYDELSKTSEGSPAWLTLVAESRMARRQYRSAFFFYKQALEKDPQFRAAREGLVAVYRASGHADWAAAEESKIPKPDCSKPNPACDFAARRYLAVAAAPSPYWRARAYNQLAIQAFSKLGDLPDSLELHQLRAQIASNNGEHLEAANQWRAALQLSPYDVDILRALSLELHDAGDFKGALEVLSKLNPQHSAAVAFLTGDSLLRSEQPEPAIPHLEAALQLDPKLLPAHASLGLAYMRVGRPGEAIPHLEIALNLDSDGSLHFQLARAFQSAGQAGKAKEAMAQYQAIKQRDESEKKKLEEEAQIVAP